MMKLSMLVATNLKNILVFAIVKSVQLAK